MADSSQDATVFFLHVMKTGGSTVLQNIIRAHPPHAVYPQRGDPAQIEKKSIVSRFTQMPPEELAQLRWIAPHLPLSVATQYRERVDWPVSIVLLLRNAVDRAVSHLRQVSRRLEHRYSYRELLDVPLLGDFFLSNHQTRVMGCTAQDWAEWDACMSALMTLPDWIDDPSQGPQVRPVDGADLERAVAALDTVDTLGLQDDFDAWWRRCQQVYGWPEVPQAPVNVGNEQDKTPPPPIPAQIMDELRERNQLDCQLYTAARERLMLQATGTPS